MLSYYFWAEDFDGVGQLRRTSGDMYFAEVRQFDEIFRQGQALSADQQRQQQQQQQQGGQNAQAAQQLAQLQKDIMNATWKLIRREIGAKPTDDFAADAKEVAESQAKAREQADALAENVRDSQSLEHLNSVFEAMDRAIGQLAAAASEPSAKPLQPALAAEQSAYQGLLKLRAREHEVVRQQQRSSSAQANSSARSQQQRQQLNQLDLASEENRYETQRDARSQPEQQADREARQVLNRLRELARRQHDLNERLKDLQSALQERSRPPRRKRRFAGSSKRLEEEQSQMLRDTDELAFRAWIPPKNQEAACPTRPPAIGADPRPGAPHVRGARKRDGDPGRRLRDASRARIRRIAERVPAKGVGPFQRPDARHARLRSRARPPRAGTGPETRRPVRFRLHEEIVARRRKSASRHSP